MLLLVAAVLWLGGICGVQCCHPNSMRLHVCLNIYLEKDFPFLETLVQGKGSRRGRILLEDHDITNICGHLTSLRDCYKGLLPECNSYWQMDRYSRLMHLQETTLMHLCSNRTKTLKDLLTNVDCLQRDAKSIVSSCASDTSDFSWIATWKEILRMQVGPADRCSSMSAYRDCLVSRLQGVLCGEEASTVYGLLMDKWLASWCDTEDLTPGEYLYLPQTFFKGKKH
ncbi:hypothetical protein JTE90_009268 [Oedothorax gibbosus]|uniref:Uncharacterized protein n=1 Tax=Oedothorax gibbosus TaxID=931172 RepID=A0AAV6V1D9_9ARAC|nr:hypothetical protein JTE90_009268 [Oedothorax gibbosus]